MSALLLLCILGIARASSTWKLRPLNQYTSILSLDQRKSANKEVLIVGANNDGFETLSTTDNGNSWTNLPIPQQDYTVVSNVPKDRLNFENLPFDFVSQNIIPFGDKGVAVTGRFNYLHSSEHFNGIAVKSDMTSNSWRIISLSTNITEVDDIVIATHSSFPTKETWYTVLSTVPSTEIAPHVKKNNNYVSFNVKTGVFTSLSHPFTVAEQEKLPSTKQLIAIYKTTSAGQEWDKIFEVKDSTTAFIQDFQCYDDYTCVALIQNVDGTTVTMKTLNGGKKWTVIHENKDDTIQLLSVFVQSPQNIWLVGQRLPSTTISNLPKSILFHQPADFSDDWNVIDPEVEGLQRIFFYNGGDGITDDDYRFVEGLIVTQTKDGQQLLQQIYAL